MPRPSSRRATAARQPKPAETEPAPEVELPEGASDEVDTSETAAPEASSRSSRRNAGRSGRRSGRDSARASAPQPKVQRELTDEERAARRAAIAFGLKLGGGIAAILLAAFIAWWLLIRVDVRTARATTQLQEAKALKRVVENNIDQKQPAAALKAWTQADTILSDSPELGHAAEAPNPDAPDLASLDLARRAFALRGELGELKVKIERVGRDERANDNLLALEARFGKLLDTPEAELEKLQQDATRYMDNPVEPGAGRNEDYVKDYKDLITKVRFQMQRIAFERDKRARGRTEDPVNRLHNQCEELVKKELFLEALSKVDEAARQNADADFKNVRAYVEEAGSKGWQSAKSYVQTRYADYAAPGTAENVRKQALREAQGRLKEVIERFGVQAYVDEAKQMLAQYPPME